MSELLNNAAAVAGAEVLGLVIIFGVPVFLGLMYIGWWTRRQERGR